MPCRQHHPVSYSVFCLLVNSFLKWSPEAQQRQLDAMDMQDELDRASPTAQAQAQAQVLDQSIVMPSIFTSPVTAAPPEHGVSMHESPEHGVSVHESAFRDWVSVGETASALEGWRRRALVKILQHVRVQGPTPMTVLNNDASLRIPVALLHNLGVKAIKFLRSSRFFHIYPETYNGAITNIVTLDSNYMRVLMGGRSSL